MKRAKLTPFMMIFLALALFGFVHALLFDTVKLIQNTLLILLVGLLFYGIYRYLNKRGYSSTPRRGGHPQSGSFAIKKQQDLPSSIKRSTGTAALKKKSRPHPFTVIEGKKNKK